MNDQIVELIAIGASVGAHFQTCLDHHIKKALEIGVPQEEIRQAIEIGHRVEKGSMAAMKKFTSSVLGKYAVATKSDDAFREKA